MPAFAAAAMVAATVVPPNPGDTSAAPRFQGDTLAASIRSARLAHWSSDKPTRRQPSKTATTAGVAPRLVQASHCRATASIAAAFGRPCVMTADSRATIGAPAVFASRMVGAMSRLLTASILRRYISLCPAGVAELVQAHGLGPCGASHGCSSPFARSARRKAVAPSGGAVQLSPYGTGASRLEVAERHVTRNCAAAARLSRISTAATRTSKLFSPLPVVLA